MCINDKSKCFPEYFKNFEMPQGAKEEDIEVYRVIKFGDINDEKSFISTFEEIERNLIPKPKRYNENDPSLYSTSCNLNKKSIEKLLKIFMRKEPRAFISKGVTKGECGLSQITIQRTHIEKDENHVDWWLYKDSKPHIYFKKVDECDE